jgi:Fic family protein
MNFEKLKRKKEILDKKGLLSDALVRNLNDWFRVELAYTSNAIEGNTLTRQETALVIEKGLTVGGKTLVEHLEARNHAKAWNFVVGQIERKPNELTIKDILNIHKIILTGIDDENAGHYRNIPVRISGSTVILPNPLKVPVLMEEFYLWLRQGDIDPVELAADAHYRLATIHPFIDGNGRTARLLMNMILLMNGYPPAIIRPRDRLVYLNSLEKAQLGGPKDDYFKIIFNAVDRSLDICLKAKNSESSILDFKDIKLFKTGELAKEVGESNSTIRHWTKEGLLDVAKLTESGYQLYSISMIERIKKIQRLKKERYSLAEIRGML